MSTVPSIPAGADPSDYSRWKKDQERRDETRSAQHEGIEWDEVIAKINAAGPETEAERVEREGRIVQYERSQRIAEFRKVCPIEFMQGVDRAKLKNTAAFDAIAGWNGRFPGRIATGPTGSSKTRAAWSALGRLHTDEKRSFAWFPVKRLISEFSRYESKDLAGEFWKLYSNYNALFVDDLDKFNAQFESEGAALFQFYDWIYRERRPCITTTNKSREWWTKLMGEAFARRLFDDAHVEVNFKP